MATQCDRGVALVTGACGPLGAIYADRLCRRGYDLILVARDATHCRRLARHLSKASGRRVDVVAADLVKRCDLRRVEQVLRRHPNIMVLINNPDPDPGPGRAALAIDLYEGQDRQTLTALAMTRLAQAAAPAFAARGGGTVINVAATRPWSPTLAERVDLGSAAFVLAFSHALQGELEDLGVLVQAVLPGDVGGEVWSRAQGLSRPLAARHVVNVDELVDAALAALDAGVPFDPSQPRAAAPDGGFAGAGWIHAEVEDPWTAWRASRRAGFRTV